MHHAGLGQALIVMLGVVACSAPAPDDALSSSQPPASSSGQAPALISTDTAVDPTVRRLEREALSLVRTDGCATVAQCRSAPMGNRPCGGPRYHVPYCALTTDTTALFAKLAEVVRAEDDYNRRAGLASTCEMRMPSELELTNGACRARAPSP